MTAPPALCERFDNPVYDREDWGMFERNAGKPAIDFAAPVGWPMVTTTLSVIIPVFNEERRIGGTIEAIHAHLVRAGIDYEAIAADDGCEDRTAAVVLQLGEAGFPVRFLPAAKHRGKGAAIRRGAMASRGDLVLITDADLSTPISEFDRLLQELRRGADIAIGSRGLSSSQLVVRQPIFRELSGRAFNLLVRTLLLPGIWDTQCGFKLMRGSTARGLFRECRIDGFAYDVELLAFAVRAGCRVAEVPVSWAHNADSRVSVGRDALGMFRDLLRITVRTWTGRYAVSTVRSTLGDSDGFPVP